MQEIPVNFDVVEATIEKRLRELNLVPRRNGGCVLTGYDYLHLSRGGSQVLAVSETDDLFFAAVEINAVMKSRAFGVKEISDLVTTRARTPENALTRCVDYYMDVTFPALQALFDPQVAASMPKIKLSSYTQPEGRLVSWKVYTGQLQLLNDTRGKLAGYISERPPLTLIFDAVTGYLAEPQLHWCKLYGGVSGETGLSFGCAIDGQKSPEAEDEISRKFQLPVDALDEWEFRQFLVFLPGGEPDEKTAKGLRQYASEQSRPSKSWWPFGKRS